MTWLLRIEECPSIECRLGCYGEKSARPSSADWVADEIRSLFSRDEIDPPGRQGHAAGPTHPGTFRPPSGLHRRRVAPSLGRPWNSQSHTHPPVALLAMDASGMQSGTHGDETAGSRLQLVRVRSPSLQERSCRCPRRTENCPGRDTGDCTQVPLLLRGVRERPRARDEG
jgi:hypothetical protein